LGMVGSWAVNADISEVYGLRRTEVGRPELMQVPVRRGMRSMGEMRASGSFDCPFTPFRVRSG